MGRALLYDDKDVFAAVARHVQSTGKLAMEPISRKTGTSIGSLYHRFQSKEGLLAETWLHAVRAFQSGFISALTSSDNAMICAERAALSTPQFCKAQPDAAIALASCSQAQFLGPKTPRKFRSEIKMVNEQSQSAITAFAKRSGFTYLQCRLALVEYPLATVKVYLPRKPVSKAVDTMVLAACRAALNT